MSHYKSNLRDLEFNLFEVFGADEFMGEGIFEDMDPETARYFLKQTEELATGVLSDSFTTSDRNPPVFDPKEHTVTMPEDFKAAYQTLMDSEGWRMEIPAELGGIVTPASVRWAVAELVLGSNPAAFMYMAGPGFAGILHDIGNEDQKKMAQRMVDGGWGATMVLTEPDAGSDVGAGTTKAYPNEDGTWRIEGVKRFITSAEHDMSDNIVHLVLARPVGVEGVGGPGTKGLSLFVVPKYMFDIETGELGERNGAYVTNVEKKMGLKVSTTCEVTFGDKEPAIGYLVGDVHQGIAQMFKVIEYARMMVGSKAIATLSTGYLNALDYAQNRVQGADLTEMLDKTAPRVPITNHPDVRRSLMLQKAYAEGMRALVMYTASWQDRIAAATLGENTEIDLDMAERINDLLLPIVKGVGSERSYELLGSQSLQTLGGSGYLQESSTSATPRSTRCTKGPPPSKAWTSSSARWSAISSRRSSTSPRRSPKPLRAAAKATSWQPSANCSELHCKMSRTPSASSAWAMASQEDPKQIYLVGLNTTRLLMMTGDLIIGWLLLRQAEVAQAALEAGAADKDVDFYTGKIAAAKWFAHNRLPLLTAEKIAAAGTDLGIMELPESAF